MTRFKRKKTGLVSFGLISHGHAASPGPRSFIVEY